MRILLLLVCLLATCTALNIKKQGLTNSLSRVTRRPRDLMLMANKYCEDTTRTIRRSSSTVTVGKVKIGSEHPVVRQTMATTSTDDVEASVAQIERIAKEGARWRV